MASNIQLKKFDMTSIKPDKVCVFIGKRETGKSFLVKDLLFYHRTFLLEQLYRPQKVLIVFMEILYLLYLFMMNINLKLYPNVLKKQKK